MMDVLSAAAVNARPLSPVELDGVSLQGVEEKIVGDSYTAIGGKYLISEWGDEEPDPSKVMDGVSARLEMLEQQLHGVASVLVPIFGSAIVR